MSTNTEHGPPNLDGLDKAELWALFRRVQQHPRKTAREWFPDRPEGYVGVTRRLGHYAANKATAMGLRAKGEIAEAVMYERICDDIYQQLPERARW
jgi:hypothetical protein